MSSTALAIRDALRALEDRDGRLTPEQVVEAARKKRSPLNACFVWDDTVAGHQYRLDQARTLIRNVKVEVVNEYVTVKTVAYVRDPDLAPRIQGYRALRKIQQDPAASREVVAEEFIRASAHLKRARELAAALVEVKEIDEILERLGILTTSFEMGSGHPPVEGHA